MASMLTTNDLRFAVKPSLITTKVFKLPVFNPGHGLAVGFEGLNAEEVATLIDCAIKIEQARTGEVLTPTEYRDRFSGLDLNGSER
jgi:hypothetical protein